MDARTLILVGAAVLIAIAIIVAVLDFASAEHQLSPAGLNAVITLVVIAVVIVIVGFLVLHFVKST